MSSSEPAIPFVQGGCASRPEMAWTNMLNQILNRPVVNLGFSSNGRLEKELIDLIIEKEAAAFIIDCLPNLILQPENVRSRTIDAVHAIRGRHPETAIVLVDHSHYLDGILSQGRLERVQHINEVGYEAYLELRSAGVGNLYYLKNSAIGLDINDSVDGIHPNDRGMLMYAEAYAEFLKSIGM